MANKTKKPSRVSFAFKQFVRAFQGYDAVRNTRYRARRGNNPIRSEEVELSSFDREKLISTCLEFRRNNPVVASLSRLRKADIVGRGVIPQPSTGDDETDSRILEAWSKFSESPEATGMMDMREMQQQMIDSLLFYGDCGLVVGKDQVQFIDGSRIGNPSGEFTSSEESEFQNGVEIDNIGKPVSYVVGNRVSGTLRDTKIIPARDFIPFLRRIRPNQYRGVPELAPVINTLQDCDEYDRVEMMAAKVSASLAVAVKRENSYEFELQNRLDGSEQDALGNLEEFEPGRFHYLEPGEDISVIGANGRPNVDGIQWVSYLLRKVGSAVGIPLEFLLMEIGGSSFSASQGVVLQYQQTVESYQSDLIRVMNRLYRRWLSQQIAAGKIEVSAAANPFTVRWQRPAFRWINKAAQVKADMEYFRAGAMSLDDITAPFGYTAEEVLTRKMQNIKKAKQIAAEGGVDWRELINPFPTSMSANFSEVISETNGEDL
jgi:lambda family phage portal protein